MRKKLFKSSQNAWKYREIPAYKKFQISKNCENFAPDFVFFHFVSLIKWCQVTFNIFWTLSIQIENDRTEKKWRSDRNCSKMSKKSVVHVRQFSRRTIEDMAKRIAALESAWKSEQNAYIPFFSALKFKCKKNHFKIMSKCVKIPGNPRTYKGPTPYIYNRKRPLWNDNFDRPLSSSGRKKI